MTAAARRHWSAGALGATGIAVALASALAPNSPAKSASTRGSGERAPKAESAGTWNPGNDPEWTPVPWARCNGAVFARKPRHAAPALSWAPCGGNARGCQRLSITWPADRPPLQSLDVSEGSVFKYGKAQRFGLYLSHRKALPVLALYDETWMPVAAWRGPPECQPQYVEASAPHVCMAFGGRPAGVALLPLSDPNTTPLRTFASAPDIPLRCNAHLFSALDPANRIYIRDLATGREQLIHWSDATAWTPRIREDYALVPRLGTRTRGDGVPAQTLEAWIWTAARGLAKLIDAGPELVVDARTDGNTLAWVQSTTADFARPARGSLWKSPFSKGAKGVKPERIRNVPPVTVTETSYTIGDGYYALIEGAPNEFATKLHIYRLEDGRHWAMPPVPDAASSPQVPRGSLTVPGRLLHIDREELWWVGYSQYTRQPWAVVRQRLDALGAGD
jgi:hypothetical protein